MILKNFLPNGNSGVMERKAHPASRARKSIHKIFWANMLSVLDQGMILENFITNGNVTAGLPVEAYLGSRMHVDGPLWTVTTRAIKLKTQFSQSLSCGSVFLSFSSVLSVWSSSLPLLWYLWVVLKACRGLKVAFYLKWLWFVAVRSNRKFWAYGEKGMPR